MRKIFSDKIDKTLTHQFVFPVFLAIELFLKPISSLKTVTL